MHDFVPATNIRAEQGRNRKTTAVWAGDVSNVVLLLREYRPDLDQSEIKRRPTGLALTDNLDPNSTVLEENYEEIVAKHREMSSNEFGGDTLADALIIASQSEPSRASYFGSGM